MFFPALALTMCFSAVLSAEICQQNWELAETVDMFANYTDLVSFTVDCSTQTGVPVVVVRAEPPLREEITMRLSVNPKAAYSVKCTAYNETGYFNYTVGVKKNAPWTNVRTVRSNHNLSMGWNCSIVGCFWDTYGGYGGEQRRYAVQGSSCITNPNECLEEPAVCEQLCINTYTGYNCSCWEGYGLDDNSHNCTDVDECTAGQHTCSHICSNTEGSYNCSCPIGFQLDDDNRTCTDINECDSGSHQCDYECKNTIGSFVCACSAGFELDDDGVSCRDIDECSPHHSHQCEHVCTNKVGSYICSCNSGFYLSKDQHNCLDIDECDNSKLCSQVCVNTTGSYYCQCLPGYTLSQDGHNCTANPSKKASDYLVFYLPWLIPLILTSTFIAFSVFIYYTILRRPKNGDVLVNNRDLYEFFDTHEKLDCSYQPVDLSNGLCYDTQSLRSEMTPFQSASNTVEDLAKLAPVKTEIVLITCDAPLRSSSKEDVKNDGLERNDTELHSSPETVAKCTTHDENVSINDSCVGSSIAGEMCSEHHNSTTLYSSDTSNTSLGDSNNTSSNSEYIPTACASKLSPQDLQPSPLDDDAMQKESVPVTGNKSESSCPSTDKDDTESSEATDTLSVNARKAEAKTKDYIHATNALFSGVERNLPNSAEF